MPLDDTNWARPVEVIDETTALLIRARSFLERGWCRTTLARTANGRFVDPKSEAAVEWCAVGAIRAATAPHQRHRAFHRLKAVIGGVTLQDIEGFNDRHTTVEPILAAFDRAIAAGGP